MPKSPIAIARLGENKKDMKEMLLITIIGREGVVVFGKKKVAVALGKKSLLSTISRVVRNVVEIQAIRVEISEASFSGTRQVIATVNALAWALGVRVNGTRQMKATYYAEPNITL